MNRRLPRLSIVSPAFNEQDVLPPFHDELIKVVDTLSSEFDVEIIYVDDGSFDATTAVIMNLAQKDPRVRYVFLSRNFGHQAALTAGLDQSTGDVIVSMDSDLQHPPKVILELIREWKKGHEIVLTIRKDHESLGFFKKLTSKLFYKLMRTMSGMDIRPAASDFRLMSRKALDALLAMPERNRFLRGMVHWLGFPRAEVAFEAPPRFAGKSKFTIYKMVKLARDGMLSFSRIPLHAALMFAGCMLAVSTVLSMVTCSIWHPQGNFCWILFAQVTAIHLGAFGVWTALLVFSEYLARVHEQVLNRPLYVIRAASPALPAKVVSLPAAA